MEKLELYRDINNVSQGTHVIVLPHNDYLKKYFNKIHYVTRSSDNSYHLHNLDHIGSSREERLRKSGIYCPVFHTDAIEGVHFMWIDGSIVYDKFGKPI